MTNDPEEIDARAPLTVANMGMVLIVSKPSGDAAKPLAGCCSTNRSKSASRSSTETASNRSLPEPKRARVSRIFHANASAAVRTDDASASARAPRVARAHPGPPAATSSTGAFAARRSGASQRQRSSRGSAAREIGSELGSEYSPSNAPGGGANTAALCPTRTSSSPRTGTSGHAAKCSSATGGARAISFQNAVNHASVGSGSRVPSSPRRLAVGDAPIPAGDTRGGSVRGSSAANCACVNSRTDISARNRGCASIGPSVVDEVIFECANRVAARGASVDISADAVHSVPDPSRATLPPAVGTGTFAKSRTAARHTGGASVFSGAVTDDVAPPRPAAASQSFTGTPAAAIASTTPVSESSGGPSFTALETSPRVDALRVARTSDAAHSMSSTCVLSAASSRPAGGGGFVLSNLRNAAAVSSRAAPPTPAAASSGRSDAGASITGKCRDMNAAASGRATPPPPHDPSANPSGRKYPSEGFNAAPPPKLRNSAFSPSSRYRGFTNNSDAGCDPELWDRPPSPSTRPSTRPSASSAGGGGSPNDCDVGHAA